MLRGGITNFFPAASRGSMTRSARRHRKPCLPTRCRPQVGGSNASAPCRSWACPAVRKKASGLPSASTMAWILVLSPPLLRPIAWSSPSFFQRRHCAGAHARWCCRSWRIRCPRRRPASRRASSIRRSWPSAKSGVNLDRVAKSFRQVPPRNAGPITMGNRFHEQPVVPGRSSDVALTSRQNIFDPVPLIVAKGVTAHMSAPMRKRHSP